MPRPKRARREPLVDSSFASDAAANEDIVRRRGRPRKNTAPSLTDDTVLGAARRKRDAALDHLAKEDATSSVGKGGRAATATPLRRGHHDSGLDLADDEVFGTLDDEFADDSFSSASGDRRPRSRQSSIVGPNDPPIRPSSRGPNTPGIASSFNIGIFRRRAREPSILGTSRKPLPAMDKSSDVEADERHTPSSSRPRKRKSGDDVDDDAPENLEQDSSSSSLSDVIVDSDSDLSVLASPPPPAPGLLFARPVTPTNNDDDDEVAAPPASSGSESGVDDWPDIHVLAKRRRRPSALMPLQTGGHQSDNNMSSPPSLTHSPNYTRAPSTRRRQTRRRASSPPKLTTAHLTNLLPKRRHRKRARYSSHPGSGDDDEEFDTTDLAPDEDELTYLDARSRRSRRPSRNRVTTTTTLSSSSSFSVHAAGGVNGSVLKPRQTVASCTRQQKASTNVKKPYLRRSSDKENENEDDDDNEDDEEEEEGEGESALVPLPDNTFDSTPDDPQRPADELKKAARKFKEVDKWELDFEEVTESCSSQDAR